MRDRGVSCEWGGCVSHADYLTSRYDMALCQRHYGRLNKRERDARKRAGEVPSSYETNIYFLRDPDGAIKIGKAVDVEKRIQALQSGNPRQLTTLLVVHAPRRLEFELHRRFEASRLQGEWFASSPELLDCIASLRDGVVSEPELLPQLTLEASNA
jgi:hypothetical protein